MKSAADARALPSFNPNFRGESVEVLARPELDMTSISAGLSADTYARCQQPPDVAHDLADSGAEVLAALGRYQAALELHGQRYADSRAGPAALASLQIFAQLAAAEATRTAMGARPEPDVGALRERIATHYENLLHRLYVQTAYAPPDERTSVLLAEEAHGMSLWVSDSHAALGYAGGADWWWKVSVAHTSQRIRAVMAEAHRARPTAAPGTGTAAQRHQKALQEPLSRPNQVRLDLLSGAMRVDDVAHLAGYSKRDLTRSLRSQVERFLAACQSDLSDTEARIVRMLCDGHARPDAAIARLLEIEPQQVGHVTLSPEQVVARVRVEVVAPMIAQTRLTMRRVEALAAEFERRRPEVTRTVLTKGREVRKVTATLLNPSLSLRGMEEAIRAGIKGSNEHKDQVCALVADIHAAALGEHPELLFPDEAAALRQPAMDHSPELVQ